MLDTNIKRLLKERNMTISQLGERIGWSQPATSLNIKSKNMSVSVMEKIAEGLGIEVWELLVSREFVEAERQRRSIATPVGLTMLNAVCPCCGKTMCVKMKAE